MKITALVAATAFIGAAATSFTQPNTPTNTSRLPAGAKVSQIIELDPVVVVGTRVSAKHKRAKTLYAQVDLGKTVRFLQVL